MHILSIPYKLHLPKPFTSLSQLDMEKSSTISVANKVRQECLKVYTHLQSMYGMYVYL